MSSPVSGIAAPLMLLPLWLDIKRRWKLPISVFVDDVVILCENKQEVTEVYEYLHNYLHRNFELELNAAKTESGQFSNGKLNFCGWNIAGGYARVSKKHVEAFKSRFKEAAIKAKGKERRNIIKCLNRKIDGFGNFYKHGNVKGQYEALDVYIRSIVRPLLMGGKRCDNSTLRAMGVRTLTGIYDKHCLKFARATNSNPCTQIKQTGQAIRRTDSSQPVEQLIATIEALSSKMTEVIAIHKQQLHHLKILTASL